MARKMNAAVVEQFGKPLLLQEWDIPSPGPGQILIKTEACGVCHTDLHAAHGDWPIKPTLPFIPGHEAIGSVVAVGSGVTIVKEGDRVGVPWLYSACGHCEHCLTGWETVCAQAQFGGYTRNGGFAEYLLADPDYVAHIPAGLASLDAAPLICAGITTYKGIKQTAAKPGEWIAISGAGGLGHLAIQYAKAMGSTTGLLLQGGCRVISLGVDHEIGANSLGMGQFPIIDVDRTNEQSHGLGILDRQMPESACSRDGDPFAGLGRGLLDPLVGSDASADQWGGIHRS